jgi:hypothetical protein
MGIDVQMLWKGMTEADNNAQSSVGVRGAQGVLRENYHDGYHFSRYLFREAFDAKPWYGEGKLPDGDYFDARSNAGYAQIPAAVLKERLPVALEMIKVEWFKKDNREVDESYLQHVRDFIALAEQKERATSTPILICVYP